MVSRIPKVVGSWPKGAEDLAGWVADGGTDGYGNPTDGYTMP